MKRYIILTLAILCLAVLTLYNPDATTKEDSVTIGVSTALTGPAAPLGEMYKAGLDAALDNIPQGNLHIELLYQDNKNTGKDGVTAFHVLLEQKPDLILSTFSPPTVATSPLIEESNIPLFVSLVFADVLSTNENAVNFFPLPADDVRATFADMKDSGIKTVGVLYVNSEYGNANLSAFEKEAVKNDIEILTKEAFLDTQVEFSTHVSKVLQTQPDALYIISINPTSLLRQIKTIDPTAILYTNLVPISANLPNLNPDIYEGIHMTALNVSFNDSQERKDLIKKLPKREDGYENNSLGYLAMGYDNLMLTSAILQKSSPQDFVETFSSYGQFKGVTGTYTIQGRNIGMKVYPGVFKNGKLVPR